MFVLDHETTPLWLRRPARVALRPTRYRAQAEGHRLTSNHRDISELNRIALSTAHDSSSARALGFKNRINARFSPFAYGKYRTTNHLAENLRKKCRRLAALA
jgi:hypothetical protein